MTRTIISKRTTPFNYQNWKVVNGQIFPDGPGVLINGGAGIVGGSQLLSGLPIDKRGTLVPEGVATVIDDEVYNRLMKNPKFVSDIKRGLIVVIDGAHTSQDEVDEIADKELIANEHIHSRPYTEKDFEDAGATLNSDGSVDIRNAQENLEAVRRENAGAPEYVKKRNLENHKRGRKPRKRFL